jgi:ComF family protein
VALRLLGDLLSPPACAACDTPVRDGTRIFCAACARTVEPAEPKDGLVAFGAFGGALAVAIRRLKYDDRPDLARPLGDLLRHAAAGLASRVDLVVPVPLHPRRLALRGYNQSALLAARLARGLVDTPPQADLSRAERLVSVAGAFEASPSARIRGVRVALVDDVATTSATLDACASALAEAGADAVVRVVIARTSGGGC